MDELLPVRRLLLSLAAGLAAGAVAVVVAVPELSAVLGGIVAAGLVLLGCGGSAARPRQTEQLAEGERRVAVRLGGEVVRTTLTR